MGIRFGRCGWVFCTPFHSVLGRAREAHPGAFDSELVLFSNTALHLAPFI